jgi:hypothetical protein
MVLSFTGEKGCVVDGDAKDGGHLAGDGAAVGAGGRNRAAVLPEPEGIGRCSGLSQDRVLQLNPLHVTEAVPDFGECSCVGCHFRVSLFLYFVCTFTFAKIEIYFQKKKENLEKLESIFRLLL